MKKHSNIIVLATGGTGGHIFPAEALAGALKERGYTPVLITDQRFGQYGGTLKQQKYHIIPAGNLGGNALKKVQGVLNITRGYLQARKLLQQYQPRAVVGFGGYPSFATMLAATHLKLPTLIHEQNSVMGKANAVLAGKVQKIATSFPVVQGIAEQDASKVVLTGNPVRPGIKAVRNMEYPQVVPGGMLKILVTGGSQGASVLSEVVPEAMALLSEELRKRIRLDHQCRPADIDAARKRYGELDVSADLATFFSDMPARLAVAHLVIARAGASTLAELAVVGRPSILVPYPHLKDDSQTVNANAMEAAGSGWVMPQKSFTPELLAEKLKSLLTLPDTLHEAAAKAYAMGSPDADKALAELVEAVIKQQETPSITQS